MKKITALLFALALPLAAQTSPPSSQTPADNSAALATILRQQRDFNAQALQDVQAQLALLAAENESLKKQLADLVAKSPPESPAEEAKPSSPAPAKSQPKS